MKYNVNISILRITATLAVVFLHTCGTMMVHPEIFSLNDYQKLSLRFGYHFFMWAVPVFFMITGFIFLDPSKNITFELIIKKYVKKMLLALIFFGLPFVSLKIYGETHSFNIAQIIKNFMENRGEGHLWYIYTLIGVYLVLPVIRSFICKADRKSILIFLTILFAFDFVIPYVSSLCGIRIRFSIPLSYPLFFVVAGYFIKILNKEKISRKLYAIFFFIIIIAILCLIYKEAYLNYAIDIYTNPLIALFALFIFFGWNIKQILLGEKFQTKIWHLDRMCFGVYLIHPLFIQFAYRFIDIDLETKYFFPVQILLLFLCFTLLSFITIFILQKIPLIQKILL